MYTLNLENNTAKLFQEKQKNKWMLPFEQMSEVIESKIQIGTNLHIVSDNSHSSKHSGQYYLLYIQEFDMVKLLYLDTNGVLREVYSGRMKNSVSAIYRNVASDTEIKVLKSSGKRAYRVIECAVGSEPTEGKVITLNYKNKSSQAQEQVYLSLFDAINLAVITYEKNRGKNTSYCVITPKNTVLFNV